MSSVNLGTGSIDPYEDDFFRKVIEECKGKDKTDPMYYFLKILANAGCYGIYAEVNKLQTGKNDPKTIGIFSGDEERTENLHIGSSRAVVLPTSRCTDHRRGTLAAGNARTHGHRCRRDLPDVRHRFDGDRCFRA